MVPFAAALLGLIAGSFLNALLFRSGTGRSALSFSKTQGRSRCMRCGHELSALDLVPVVSWLTLKGRCRYCGTRISLQYPLVELSAATLALGVALLNTTPFEFALWFVVWMTLLYTLVYDVRHKIIPWACSGTLAALGLVWVGWSCLHGACSLNNVSLFAGPLVAAPLLLLSLVSKGRWMGWGDGALMLGVGWLVGLTAGYSALLIGFWSGASVGIVLLALNRGYTMRSELPFAPFLILGAGVAYFLHADIFSILTTLLG